MSTEAQLKALSNSELASGTQIPALKHRTVNNAIIEEMYDSQSRGDVLSGVQSALSLASGDQVLVIRSGAAFLLDATEFGFVDTLADLTDVSIPSPSNDQILAYNSGTSKWVAKDVNDLTSVVSITGAATTNQMVKFTGANSIGDSIVSDDGTTVNVGGNLSVDNNLTVGTINSGTSSDFVKGDGSLDSTDYQSQIDTEEAARISADTTLQSNIDSEESSRIAADAVLQGGIDAEGLTRQAADADLQSQIDSNDTDISNLQSSKQDTSEKGQANGYAPLDSGAKVAEAYLPDSILGQVSYQGTWAASTNTPTLANPPASTTKGEYYVSSDDGTQFGITFQTGDWIISNGTEWEKVDNTDAVTKVFNRIGNIVANQSDYASFYPLVGTTISAGSGLTGGGDLSANRTISHADTSSQSSVDNSGGAVIQDIALDEFGHVAALGSVNLDARYIQSETDTLASVTTRNPTTTNAITVGGLTVNGTAEVTSRFTAGLPLSGLNASYDNGMQRNLAIQGTNPYINFTTDASTTATPMYVQGLTATNTLSLYGSGGIELLTNTTINGNLAVDTDTLYVDAVNDRVGINNSSPSDLINVSGGTGGSYGITIDNAQVGGGLKAAFQYDDDNAIAVLAGNTTNGLSFKTLTLGNLTEKMRIDSAGNVLVGLTSRVTGLSAVTQFEVSGNQGGITINSNQTTADKYSRIMFTKNGATGNEGLIRYNVNDYHMAFWTNATERMRIDSSGNVGIGETNPQNNLHISGDSGVARIRLEQNSVGTERSWVIGTDNGPNGFFIQDLTAGANRLFIDTSGNVGIGTSSPSAKLHVKGASNYDGIIIADNSTTTGGGIFQVRQNGATSGNLTVQGSIQGNSNTNLALAAEIGNGISFFTDGSTTEDMTITSLGNVGIGATNPSTKLDVNGSFSVETDTIYAASGNVGIGVVPTARLDVNGTSRFRNNVGINQSPGIDALGVGGNVVISGSLSKGSGSFKIDHPLPEKKDTHHLVHSFVEAPQADNIYRGKIDLADGKATVNLDEAGRMTEGTFVLLNGNIQCFTSNESGWTAIRGMVEGNTLTIEAQDAECTDTISWLVIGERIDQHMIDTEWTDENGRVITEPLKEVEPTPSEEITE